MKKFLKILGAAALIAGFAPYHIEKDEETGAQKVQALLWSVTKGPGKDDGKDEIVFDFGLQAPFKKDEEETHLFTDELTVDYGSCDVQEPECETADEPVEVDAPQEPEILEEPETPDVNEEA